MKVLLDTHTLIWWDSDSSKLPSQVFSLIEDENNQVFVSVVSIWEIQIKVQIGKLKLRADIADIITAQQTQNNLEILLIGLDHALKIGELPLHHRDPFDRLLIGQALVEDMTILSKDAVFQQYNAKVIW